MESNTISVYYPLGMDKGGDLWERKYRHYETLLDKMRSKKKQNRK